MNEQKETVESWLDPSPVGNEFMKHEQAMKPAATVPVGKSFAIAPGLHLGMLRKMAEGFKPKRIVVIDHGEAGFEVRRLENNSDVALFYNSISEIMNFVQKAKTKVEPADIVEEQHNKVKALIVEFLEQDEAKISIYDPKAIEMREKDCVSYVYISRRLSATSPFRNDKGGATKALARAISALESQGALTQLSEKRTDELFNTSADVFQINKVAFIE